MIKVCIFDLDGTLFLNHGKSVLDLSARSIKALELLKENNIICAINSGRSNAYGEYILNHYDFKDKYVSGFNGAIITDNYKEVFKYPISKELIFKVNKLLKEFKLNYEVSFIQSFNGERYLSSPIKYYLERYRKANELDPVKIKIHDEPYLDLLEGMDNEFAKLSIITKDEVDNELLYNFFKDQIGEDNSVTSSTKVFLEITNKKADKGKLIDYLMSKYKLKNDEIACFGDSFNDYAMFKKVKYSFVMDHAEKKLKEKCYMEVKDVLEGVLKVFEINKELL